MEETTILGIYKHYKGGLYTILDVALHTEDDELLVIYQNAKGDRFARPYDMFFGEVFVDGECKQRFKYIGGEC